MMRGGAKSKSKCGLPAVCRRSPSTREPGITLPRIDIRAGFLRETLKITFLILAALGCQPAAFAQLPFPNPQPPPPGEVAKPGSGPQGGSIKVTVNLVVLHTSVLDKDGKFVDNLKQENFRVFEDKGEQKLSIFRNEDVPVSMGLVIDNSGSMKEKRARVNEAAITLVQASNPQDEAFVVNFNDDFFLDLDKDFTNSIPELKEALERIDARGSTALYDAIIGSLDHLKKASKDKRVLLVVTDGDDNTSRNSLEKTLKEIQKTSTVIYTIGLLGKESSEEKREAKKAKKALQAIATASGGLAFFPANVAEVHAICEQVAHDIRHQYTLAYYPSNAAQDGTFRTVRVDVIPPRGRGKLMARTRNGYYAPGSPAPAQSPAPSK
jgi:VWFA-related protein